MVRSLLDLMDEKIVVFDGAMGTGLQMRDLGPDDFAGLEGCNEILVETRPDVIRELHAGYLEVGCDVVETNSFGSNGVVLAEYGIADRAYELSRTAASVAREAVADFSTEARPRFVCGSIGPGTKLPTVGHIEFRALRDAFLPQVQGLLDGGADALIIETCQDVLQIKAVRDAVRIAFERGARKVPILVSVTIETTGTMLVGTDVPAAVAILWPLGVDVIGMNCATGPDTMKRHVQQLAACGPARLSAMPNAGLPQNVDGQIVYPMGPTAFADWVEGFVREDGVGVVGGCCGTTPAHLRELVSRVGGLAPPRRQVSRPSEAASLYQAVSLVQEPPPLLVGERMNANGSKAFRERLLADDVDGMLEVAREQERGGAHLLDLSVAYVGRDEHADMTRLVPELARMARLPLVIDSTDPDVIEEALERHGGRCVINSINLEDGRERFDRIASLARRFGAALIALVIDEDGMAQTTERKLAVARRIHDLCVHEHGLTPQDLVFDMLTFTVASGDPGMRRAAVETLDAVERVKQELPGVHTILGVSNVSFGLKPAIRRVLNSVFLSEAVGRGLDQAIVNAAGILPLNRIAPELADVCRRLLSADWSAGDPLAELLERYAEAGPRARDAVAPDDESAVDRLRRQVIDGVRKGIESPLDTLLAEGRAALAIINEELIPAMKRVGELFASGEMQLPFVLQSAEVMKAAVKHLEPHIERVDGEEQATVVLATVKGDVHDIGKNLVDIILTNNGYRVVNLGIKIQVEEMLAAVAEHQPQALGMSGLLVKSTIVMRENLEEMVRRGVKLPVLLGGAALTREYVEKDLRAVYGGDVHYCADAFEAIQVLGRGAAERAEATDSDPLARPRAESSRAISLDTPVAGPGPRIYDAGDSAGDDAQAPKIDHTIAVPVPPFWGSRTTAEIPLGDVFALLNETTLFRGQWRYRRGKMSREEYEELVAREVRPTLESLKAAGLAGETVAPQAVWGYFPAYRAGREVIVLDPDTRAEAARFSFPRKKSAPHWCIADFVRERRGDETDVLGLFVVTAGASVAEKVQKLFAANAYRDYLHLHGFAVETAEATAEWLHGRMRAELGIDADDAEGHQAMVRQGYRGSRYSFGYPACPDLEAQRELFRLLEPQRIGVELTEGFQMVPEYSVSAIVVHHPAAKYFDLD